MLRSATKKKLNSIIELQLQLHKQGIMEQAKIHSEVLEDCQQAALSVGQRLEKEVPDRTELVEKLEQYCEELYQLSLWDQAELTGQAPETEWCKHRNEAVARMDTLLMDVREELAQIPAVYQAVFMPYKAEMWDSLESVWMAFDRDENCEALVMPLPYSQFDAGTQKWSPCYEGDRFPEYVPITDYHEYHIEEEYPEFVFIHNPYDEYNRVTRINPEYFSYELKKYTKTLVYIPYYLTSGFVQEEHKLLSVYRYMDYMIAQSELFKESMKETPFYDKLLALGSPKLDRVIRLCEEYRTSKEDRMSSEWRKVIGDKKCVMLNTSLGYFLRFGERYLRKVRACIDWIKENPIVALIWRPHPLFESTIRSLRPELLPMYQDLVQHFLDSGIGVFDQTPDIAHTIAVVDAYIGDDWTSVVNLFGAAGRPMFILDATRMRAATEEEKRRVSLAGTTWNQDRIIKVNGKLWVTSRHYNGLLCVDEDWNQVEYIHRFEGQPHWNAVYGGLLVSGQQVYLQPAGATCPMEYGLNTGEEIGQGWKEDGKSLGWSGPIPYKDSLFYLSVKPECLGIYEYRKDDGRWKIYEECLREFAARKPVDFKGSCITGWFFDKEHYLWCTAAYANSVLRFDFETHEHRFYEIGPENSGYSGICLNGDILYLGEIHERGKLIEVNLRKSTLQEYPVPQKGRVWRSPDQTEMALGGIIDVGKYLVFTPAFSDHMWRFEKKTGEFVPLMEAFWTEAAEEADSYFVKYHGICNFCSLLDDRSAIIMAQRVKDDAILIMNVETGDYEVKYMYLSEEAYRKLTDGEDGFQKGSITAPFVQYESRFFCFEDFIRKVAAGELEAVKERQKDELVTLAANMDGSCGEKVWEHLKKSSKLRIKAS